MTIKTCIFDLDGVLVDTAKYHFLAWKALAEELKIPFTQGDNERLKGVSRKRSLEIILELGNRSGISEEEKISLADKKNNLYVQYIETLDHSEILDGVEPFLEELRGAGIGIALGSASKNAPRILDRLGLSGYFDALIDGNSVSKAKPDPEVFLKGAEALESIPRECVVFEDAKAGVEAALAGGMFCVGIGEKEQLGQAHLVIKGLHEMNLERLKSLG